MASARRSARHSQNSSYLSGLSRSPAASPKNCYRRQLPLSRSQRRTHFVRRLVAKPRVGKCTWCKRVGRNSRTRRYLVCSSVGSHFVSTKALRKAVIQVDKYLRKTVTTVDEEKTDTERVWSNNYDRVVGSLNAFGGLTFILGTLFASAFFLCNLE